MTTDGTGVEFFGVCMSLKRFKFLLRALRFDDLNTRNETKLLDNLAPIRDVFESFVENCKANCNISEYIIIPELLRSKRKRLHFFLHEIFSTIITLNYNYIAYVKL